MDTPLWLRTLQILSTLKPAFTRKRTFHWFCVAAVGLLIRPRIDAVTGMAAAVGGASRIYLRLLGFFASSAVCPRRLAVLWGDILCHHPLAVRMKGRILLALDGIKAPRSGLKMPAVKRLHQSASTNTKPEYITGHSLQSTALLMRSLNGVAAVPLFSRILEGLKGTPRDGRSQLDRLPEFLAPVVGKTPFYLVADAYYASGAFAKDLVEMGGHLITRARGGAVAYQEPKSKRTRKRGRPRKYGKKVLLKDLAKDKSGYLEAESPLYGEEGVTLWYKEVVLFWKPVQSKVKFILVRHPSRGKGVVFLMTTDLTLDPMEVLVAYGLRFKIEVSFKSAVHTIGTFAYHFWTDAMPKRKRVKGDLYTHRMPRHLAERVWRKFESYHVFLQVAAIAQGIAQILAAEMPVKVMALDSEYRRTVIPLPSEATVKKVMEKTCRIFAGMTDCPRQCVNQMENALREGTPEAAGRSAKGKVRYG